MGLLLDEHNTFLWHSGNFRQFSRPGVLYCNPKISIVLGNSFLDFLHDSTSNVQWGGWETKIRPPRPTLKYLVIITSKNANCGHNILANLQHPFDSLLGKLSIPIKNQRTHTSWQPSKKQYRHVFCSILPVEPVDQPKCWGPNWSFRNFRAKQEFSQNNCPHKFFTSSLIGLQEHFG